MFAVANKVSDNNDFLLCGVRLFGMLLYQIPAKSIKIYNLCKKKIKKIFRSVQTVVPLGLINCWWLIDFFSINNRIGLYRVIVHSRIIALHSFIFFEVVYFIFLIFKVHLPKFLTLYYFAILFKCFFYTNFC